MFFPQGSGPTVLLFCLSSSSRNVCVVGHLLCFCCLPQEGAAAGALRLKDGSLLSVDPLALTDIQAIVDHQPRAVPGLAGDARPLGSMSSSSSSSSCSSSDSEDLRSFFRKPCRGGTPAVNRSWFETPSRSLHFFGTFVSAATPESRRAQVGGRPQQEAVEPQV